MMPIHSVAEVRVAEEILMAGLRQGELMERAAAGLADACAALLREAGGSGASGSRVCMLIGSGNNGGDALFAGARLAARGAHVDAVLLSGRAHEAGLAALLAAGGRATSGEDTLAASELLVDADLVVDGIVGIGGSGALRPAAAELVHAAEEGGALIVSVDVPSGVDADTGAVADPHAAVRADVTVTFGCMKPGLLLSPGRDCAGAALLVDIGLVPALPPSTVFVLDDDDIAECVPEPGPEDYKYSRGVVGIAAGSARYRGAAFMATAAARQGDAGMVHFLDRGDGIANAIVDRFWDVVVSCDAPASVVRVTAWGVGPGLGSGPEAEATLEAVLTAASPVLVDADGLRLLVHPRPRAARESRVAAGLPTVLTPHEGEFAALGFAAGEGGAEDRLGAARRAAADLGCVVVLKGPGTVIAAPSGRAYIDTRGGPELGTAGSGDVLSGLVSAMLATSSARSRARGMPPLDDDAAAHVAAAGVALHGMAGQHAARDGRPVTATDIIGALPEAISSVRRGRPA